MLTIEGYQDMIDKWVKTVGVRYFSELTNTAILMEEVGEVARIMARTYGDQSFKAAEKKIDLADELADVLFVVVCLANQTGIDLTPETYILEAGFEALHGVDFRKGCFVGQEIVARMQYLGKMKRPMYRARCERT